MPACSAAAIIASASSDVSAWSETFSGPPVPWYSSSPRAWFSALRKKGSTESQSQPVQPRWRQPS